MVLKLRAWDNVNKRMGHFEPGFGWNDEYYLWHLNQVQEEHEMNFMGVPPGDNIDFSLFTGLVDKNNKEAYFGDICHLCQGFDYNGGAYTMEQDEYGEPYFVSCKTDRKDIFRLRFREYFTVHGKSNFEVFANIYQNPELI